MQPTTTNSEKRELVWGTYGKGGVEHCGGHCPEHKLEWVKVVDRESSHLQAILRTQRYVHGTAYQRIIEAILRDRGLTPEKFSYEAEQEMFRKASAGQAKWFREQAGKPS